MNAIKYLLLVGMTMLIGACGGGGGGNGGTGAGVPQLGKVVDGYVQGAQVYIVPIGAVSASQARFTANAPTDAQGNFTFTGVDEFLAANAGNNQYQYLSVGGTNTATGALIPAGTVYTGPLGCKVLTPVTTLVMKTASVLAGGAPVSQTHIDQALGRIAAVSGIEASQAAETLLNTDAVANAAGDANATKALALQLTIAQLAEQGVVDSSRSFGNTVTALANKLATAGSAPMNVVALATSAAASDATSQARAEVISASVLDTVSQIASSTRSQTSQSVSTVMAQMERELSSNLDSQLVNVVASSDVAAAANQVTNSTTTEVIGSVIDTLDKTATAADLQDASVKSYLLRKASEGGIAQLLGIDVLTITPGNVATKALARAAQKVALPGLKKAAAASANPCVGVANNASVPLGCADLLGSDFCAGAASGFQASLACVNQAPASISVTLNSFNSPALGTPLSGSLTIDSSSMTFDDLSNGSTTFNGAVSYGSGANGSLELAVKSMTVTSPFWSTLNLDSFSRCSITPALSGGQNVLAAYLSGSGTVAGTGQTQELGLSYRRYQDAVKTAIGSGYSDTVQVTLNGQVRQGTEVVKFTDFGLHESRHFAGASDENYLSKSSSFDAGSKISTSKYGYAFFNGDNLNFSWDAGAGRPVYQSGILSLTTQ